MSREIDVRTLSNAALAYLGDSVIELAVREHLVSLGYSSSSHLNSAALDFVRASAQAQAMKRIMELLDEEESAIYRRGRNVGHTNTPRSATVSEYRTATGMETLFGWLHVNGRQERIKELFAAAYALNEENENN